MKASRDAETHELHLSLDDVMDIPEESVPEKQVRVVQSFDGLVGNKTSLERIDGPSKSSAGVSKVLTNEILPLAPDCEQALVTKNSVDKTAAPVLKVSSPAIYANNYATVSYRIPNVKMDSISGDVMQFPAWENSFEALIGDKVDCSKYKVNLLSQYLSGELRQLIQGLLLHQGEEAYTAARQRLRSRCGDPSAVLRALWNRLGAWPGMKSGQSKDLMRFSDFLKQTDELGVELKGLCIFDYAQEARKIIPKLPTYLHHKWKEKACYKDFRIDSATLTQLKTETRKAVTFSSSVSRRNLFDPDRIIVFFFVIASVLSEH